MSNPSPFDKRDPRFSTQYFYRVPREIHAPRLVYRGEYLGVDPTAALIEGEEVIVTLPGGQQLLATLKAQSDDTVTVLAEKVYVEPKQLNRSDITRIEKVTGVFSSSCDAQEVPGVPVLNLAKIGVSDR